MIIGIVTLPALTKNYSAEYYGIWAQILATVTLLSPFFAMELDMAVVRFLSGENDPLKRRKALGTMLVAVTCFSILAYVIVNLLAAQLSQFLFASSEYTLFVRLTFLWVITDCLWVFFSAYFRSRGKIRLLSIRQVAYSLSIMVIVIALTSLGFRLEWVVGCVIFAQAVLVLFFVIMVVREIGWPLPGFSGLKAYFAFSLPQIPATALLWLIASSDRYLITHMLSLSQAGIYASSVQLAVLTRMFFAPVCYVLYPVLSRLWDERHLPEVRKYLQHATRLLLTLGIPASVGLALLSQPLLQVLTTSEFLAGTELVLFLSIGTVFLGLFMINQHIILLAKKTRLLPCNIAVAAAGSLTMNVGLIPRLGLIGAGITNVVSYFVLALIVTLIARREVKYSLDFKYLAKVIGATLPMAACLYFMNVEGIWSLILAVLVGSIVFIAGIWLLRAFSEEDKQLFRRTLGGLLPGYHHKEKKI
jgi:O-antigen/teichoic acid export membrane protein